MKTEGVVNLWKGNGVNVMKCFPMNAFSLAFKDAFAKALNVKQYKDQRVKFLFASMLAGGMAGACTISIVYPIDFVRTRVTADVLTGGSR